MALEPTSIYDEADELIQRLKDTLDKYEGTEKRRVEQVIKDIQRAMDRGDTSALARNMNTGKHLIPHDEMPDEDEEEEFFPEEPEVEEPEPEVEEPEPEPEPEPEEPPPPEPEPEPEPEVEEPEPEPKPEDPPPEPEPPPPEPEPEEPPPTPPPEPPPEPPAEPPAPPPDVVTPPPPPAPPPPGDTTVINRPTPPPVVVNAPEPKEPPPPTPPQQPQPPPVINVPPPQQPPPPQDPKWNAPPEEPEEELDMEGTWYLCREGDSYMLKRDKGGAVEEQVGEEPEQPAVETTPDEEPQPEEPPEVQAPASPIQPPGKPGDKIYLTPANANAISSAANPPFYLYVMKVVAAGGINTSRVNYNDPQYQQLNMQEVSQLVPLTDRPDLMEAGKAEDAAWTKQKNGNRASALPPLTYSEAWSKGVETGTVGSKYAAGILGVSMTPINYKNAVRYIGQDGRVYLDWPAKTLAPDMNAPQQQGGA